MGSAESMRLFSLSVSEVHISTMPRTDAEDMIIEVQLHWRPHKKSLLIKFIRQKNVVKESQKGLLIHAPAEITDIYRTTITLFTKK